MKHLTFLFIMGILGLSMSRTPINAQEPETTIQVLLIEGAGYHPDEVNMLRTLFKTLTGITVALDTAPYDGYIEQLLESGKAYDVCALDQIRAAELAAQGVLMPLDNLITREMRRDIAPALKEAFVYQQQTWGMPFLLNLQFLFYNERILREAGFSKPPASLETLVDYMRAIKAQGLVEYPWTDAWQPGESLVMEFAWLLGAFEGQLFTPDGQAAFDQAPGVTALEFMKMLVDDGLAPPQILHQDEIAATHDFLAERAAFTSNWLFLHGLLQTSAEAAIAGNGKMSVLPASASATVKSASVLSVQGLAILAAAPHKEAAWTWVQFFTSPLAQRAFLHEMPIWTSVQTSAEAVLRDPALLVKRDQLLNAALRPNLARYEQVSAILQTAIYQALLGNIAPGDALSQAKQDIEPLLKP